MGRYQALALIGILVPAVTLAAEDGTCLLCPAAAYAAGNVSFGVAAVDQSERGTAPYGEWPSSDAFPWLGAEFTQRADDGDYLTGTFALAGADQWSWRAEAGSPGTGRLWFDGRRLTTYRSPDARSPFIEGAGGTLTLPSGWVAGDTTAAMSALPGALHEADLGLRHETLAAGADFVASDRWQITSRIRRYEVRGRVARGAVIGNSFAAAQAVILPAPRDQQTTDFELAAHYDGGGTSQFTVGYLASRFDNAVAAIRWHNPYDPAATSTQGALGTAPDNLFHQIYIQGRHRLGERRHGTFRLAYNRSLQDAGFADATANPSLTSPALPRASLDGRVDGWLADLQYLDRPSDALTLRANYRQEDQENLTPRDTYAYVIADTALSSQARANMPYSYRTQRGQLAADYRFGEEWKLDAGLQRQITSRTYQSVRKALEDTLWTELAWRGETAGLTLRLTGQNRDADGYDDVGELQPAENTLMRKFTLADRRSNRAKLRGDTQGADGRWEAGMEILYALNEYPDTQLGLQQADEQQVQLDASYALHRHLNLYVFVGQQGLESQQAGVGWAATLRDTTLNGGIELRWQRGDGRIVHTLALQTSDFRGATAVSGTSYPELRGEIQRLAFTTLYRVSDATSWRIQLGHERVATTDWSTQGIAPDSMSNVLTLGEGNADYRAWLIYVAMRNTF